MFGEFLGQRREAAQAERQSEREMAHRERMMALEMGRPLPEVEAARAAAEAVKARAEAGRAIVASIIAGIVPLGVCGIGVAATAIIVARASASLQMPALALVWVCCAIVGLAPAAAAVLNSRRWHLRFHQPAAVPESIELSDAEAQRLGTAIQP